MREVLFEGKYKRPLISLLDYVDAHFPEKEIFDNLDITAAEDSDFGSPDEGFGLIVTEEIYELLEKGYAQLAEGIAHMDDGREDYDDLITVMADIERIMKEISPC